MSLKVSRISFLAAIACTSLIPVNVLAAESANLFQVSPEDDAAVQRASDAARQHDYVAAEDELAGSSRHTSGSTADHLEMAQRLVALATAMAREANRQSADALTKMALSHATQAYNGASNKSEQAQAKARSGWIYERLKGDIPTAIAHYRVAAAADPQDPEIARELTRLVAMVQNLRAKLEHARKVNP